MWVPLHQHSEYSILEAFGSIKALVAKAAENNMSALALTDRGNLYGAVEFYKVCKEHSIKPIIGCELYVAPESRFDKKKINGRVSYNLILLVKNDIGYKNLCRLSSLGFVEGFYYSPRIDKEILAKYSEGLICLSDGIGGHISQIILNGTEEDLYKEVQWYKDLFGEDYYFEVQNHAMSVENQAQFKEAWQKQQYEEYIQQQQKVNERLFRLGDELGIKIVATNDSHYFCKDDWLAHEVLINIQSGEPLDIWNIDSRGNRTFKTPNPKRKTYSSREYYFKSAEEMALLFQNRNDVLQNSLEIADKCDFHFDFHSKTYPKFVPDSLSGKDYSEEDRKQEAEYFLRQLCEQGIKERYTPEKLEAVSFKFDNQDPIKIIKDRLELELAVIIPKEMGDYLLIVRDFIMWAKNNYIPVGPGRGSGAGSIVLYLIGVTDIEPICLDLFFERFINPERISYPDIDVDVCMEGRERLIEYSKEKYGDQNIAQIITFGTMKARMAVKDVGRVLAVPLSKVNQIIKFIPEDLNITICKALEVDADLKSLYDNDDETRQVLDLAKKLEKTVRNTGIHAAGLIVSGEPLINKIPICSAKDSSIFATQFSMKPVEAVGMLKIDFLGLKTLTSITYAINSVKENTGLQIDWVNLNLKDFKTFELLQKGKTLGVFQMESGGMQELCKQLKPDRFEEIIAIGALYRPGPMDMIPSFVNRKYGKEQIEYDHQDLENILKETYGIMVYQEQVMQIAQNLAGYSLGEGDVLRRAMGKKDLEQMAKERSKFCSGAQSRGIHKDVAGSIFDKMERFASYGFNKSHAAAYGFLTYVTAFLKANYTGEWLAALMTCDRHDTAKIAKFIKESQSMQIDILPPDVNDAGKEFVSTAKGIRFAMTGIKGIGEGVVESIIQERKANGKFNSFYDFFKRVDFKKIGKKTIESLVDAGCFDFTTWSRDALKQSIEDMYTRAMNAKKGEEAGEMMLSFMKKEDEKLINPPIVTHFSSTLDVLMKEKELLGFFVTGHPMQIYKDIIDKLDLVSACDIGFIKDSTVVAITAVLEDVQIKFTKLQKKFAVIRLSDESYTIEVFVWPDVYDKFKELFTDNNMLWVIVQIESKEGQNKLSIKHVEDLANIKEDNYFEYNKKLETFKQKNTTKVTFTENRTKAIVKKDFVTLSLNMNLLQLSNILEIKQLIANNLGNVEIRILLMADSEKKGELHVSNKMYINVSENLQKALEEIPGVHYCLTSIQV